MRIVCAALPKTKSGQPAFEETRRVRWQFYEAMLFMKDCFIDRDMGSPLTDEEGESDIYDTKPQATEGTSSSDEDEDHLPASVATTITAADQPTTSNWATANKTSKRKLTKTDKLIEFEHKRLKALTEILTKEEKPTDEWQKYTDSLTDDLRYITHPLLKTQIKSGIANLISQFIEQQYEMNNSNKVLN